MIKREKFFDGKILNLSGVMANAEMERLCRGVIKRNADAVRKCWRTPSSTIITHEECIRRAAMMLDIARSHPDASGVWIRPMKSAPFLYPYIEDMLLDNGITVVLPVEDYVAGTREYPFTTSGWWVIPPFEK